MCGFFAFGSLMSGTAAVALTFPGTDLDRLWILNPHAQPALVSMGTWAIVLMIGVSMACAASAVGLWTGAKWGQQTAVAVLVVNLLGDLANTLFRGDLRTLIGLPIAGAMIAYLFSVRARTYFQPKP